MQTTVRKTTDKKKEKIKDETPRKNKEDEMLKKASYPGTPRSFVQKASTQDIYKQKKPIDKQGTKAPRKTGTTHTSNNVTPMKDLLKSSPSSISQISVKSDRNPKIGSKRVDTKAKDLKLTNVTVNSPVARRKLNITTDSKPFSPIAKRKINMELNSKTNSPIPTRASSANTRSKEPSKVIGKKLERGDSREIEFERHRSKTRTLDAKEVKVLTPDSIDNNSEMQNLSKRLGAKPKAFYVDLDENKTKGETKSSDEEVSYEDDFESYESDFDSYHSDESAKTSNEENDDEKGDEIDPIKIATKETKDEEKMLDSGSFDLRDQRSATRKPGLMEHIMEDTEEDKKLSLTDEGFQDMSSSSAVSSMRTHIDVLDRPLFIDFSKSKETKRKRKEIEKLKQRATDLLVMITLHEMSYTLFELKPIPYDLYMATFGRSNYTQVAVQTFDDGITEEVQTEDILYDHKWTQHPVKFSKQDVYLYTNVNNKIQGRNEDDYLTKFSFLTDKDKFTEVNNHINVAKDYKENPLRIYFEQKDGVGSCEMLPYENYKSRISNNHFNVTKLSKFLKKVESKVSNILSVNSGTADITELAKNSRLPFSKGFLSISPKNDNKEELSFLKHSKISNLVFSQTKNNLIMSVHQKSTGATIFEGKAIICIWDISVAKTEPLKILVAIDNISIGRLKGNTDGVVVAALEDGSIHLWDLSEEPTWRNYIDSKEKEADLVEVQSDRLTQTEIDREWNLKNSNVGYERAPIKNALQACAYTSSAANLTNGDVVDYVVGLEFLEKFPAIAAESGRKIAGQICSLQRIGIITIWSIVQDKKSKDIGKAYWSKMKLEKTQTITLSDHMSIDVTNCSKTEEDIINFNLNAAKKRLSSRKLEKRTLRRQLSRPKSSDSSEFNISRPSSSTSLLKKVLSVEKNQHETWEEGIVCYDLKIMRVNTTHNYLVARNCGMVYCCTRTAGTIKINRFYISTDTSTITCLEVSPHGLPYFLAATDTGTVNLCSLLESRVLLTLDCRNGPSEVVEKCHSDNKGRFVSSAKVRSPTHRVDRRMDSKLQISSLHWSHWNPCSMYTVLKDGALVVWDLTRSDIYSRSITPQVGPVCSSNGNVLAFIAPEGEIQIHKLTDGQSNNQYLDIFNRYVELL